MFKKFKELFRKLFGISKIQYIEASKEVKNPISNKNIQPEKSFKNQIIINNEKENRALKLQYDFRNGMIKEEDISDEDFDLLANLYLRQIKEAKQEIQKYKERIIAIKSEIKQSN